MHYSEGGAASEEKEDDGRQFESGSVTASGMTVEMAGNRRMTVGR